MKTVEQQFGIAKCAQEQSGSNCRFVSGILTIQIKATEQFFPVVLIVVFYKMVP